MSDEQVRNSTRFSVHNYFRHVDNLRLMATAYILMWTTDSGRNCSLTCDIWPQNTARTFVIYNFYGKHQHHWIDLWSLLCRSAYSKTTLNSDLAVMSTICYALQSMHTLINSFAFSIINFMILDINSLTVARMQEQVHRARSSLPCIDVRLSPRARAAASCAISYWQKSENAHKKASYINRICQLQNVDFERRQTIINKGIVDKHV